MNRGYRFCRPLPYHLAMPPHTTKFCDSDSTTYFILCQYELCELFFLEKRHTCLHAGSRIQFSLLYVHTIILIKYWCTDKSSLSSGWNDVTSWRSWRAATICPLTIARARASPNTPAIYGARIKDMGIVPIP